jgi:antitoxin CcdA
MSKPREQPTKLSDAGEATLKAPNSNLGKQWLKNNRVAIESSNAWVEKHGLPLARFRHFL